MSMGTTIIVKLVILCIMLILLNRIMDDILTYISSRLLKCGSYYIYYRQVIRCVGSERRWINDRFFKVPRHLKREFELKYMWLNENSIGVIYELDLDDSDVKEKKFKILAKEDLM